MVSVIRLSDIPDSILKCISNGNEKSCYLNGVKIKKIFIFRNQYRINTLTGQYRYDIDSGVTIEVY